MASRTLEYFQHEIWTGDDRLLLVDATVEVTDDSDMDRESGYGPLAQYDAIINYVTEIIEGGEILDPAPLTKAEAEWLPEKMIQIAKDDQ